MVSDSSKFNFISSFIESVKSTTAFKSDNGIFCYILINVI
jgi:hypothetical protein